MLRNALSVFMQIQINLGRVEALTVYDIRQNASCVSGDLEILLTLLQVMQGMQET